MKKSSHCRKWVDEREKWQITENAPSSLLSLLKSFSACQNSLLLLAAILHSLVHPTYAMYYPVKILILQKLNLCKVSKKTYMYDDKESWNEFKLTHIPVNTNWLWNHCTLWIYIISKWAKKKPSLILNIFGPKIKFHRKKWKAKILQISFSVALSPEELKWCQVRSNLWFFTQKR